MSQSTESRKSQSNGTARPLFASLTGGLMARKGEAAPAPAHLDGVAIHSHGVAREQPPAPVTEAPPVARTPAPVAPPPEESSETSNYEDLYRRAERRAAAASGDCCVLPLPQAVVEPLPHGAKSTVTARLDRERIRKVKILAARMGTTNQKVMLAALDHYLRYVADDLASECPCLAKSMASPK